MADVRTDIHPGGMLIVLMEPPSTLEEEFNDWYDTEHFPQRSSMPGFLSGRRWVCLDGWPRWAALYDLQSVAALESEAYRAASGSNSTPWSKRLLPRMLGRTRAVLRTVDRAGTPSAHPSCLLLMRFLWPDDEPAASGQLAQAISALQSIDAVDVRILAEDSAKPYAHLWIGATFDKPMSREDIPKSLRNLGTRGANLFNLYTAYSRG